MGGFFFGVNSNGGEQAHSNLFNMALTNGDAGYPCSCPFNKTRPIPRPGGNASAIVNGTVGYLQLADVAGLDFRPVHGSPLVDAGVVWAPYTDGFLGHAPDAGAYEMGGVRWVAGCTHDARC